jgi:hypothetical protein
MKTGYRGLWALLVVAFAAFVIASAFDTIPVLGHDLKTTDIINLLTESHTPEPQLVCSTIADSTDQTVDTIIVVNSPTDTPIDTTAQRILLIGDSMLEGLSPRLAAYAKANGHELSTVIWYSSTSQIWGQCDTLSTFIRRYKPTYVMVCLGANELFVRNIEQRRDRYIKRIIQQIGNRPYLWIGPPNWKEDTGINNLIAKNTADGSFFLSNGINLTRAADGAHPTRRAAAMWVDSIVRWMPQHSSHPIRMNLPTDSTARPRRIVVLQPKK